MTVDIQAPERLLPTSIAQLQEYRAPELGVTGWHLVTQDDVDAFAEITCDQQWIHVDPVRAAAGPFRGKIAHGYHTLSLAPVLLDQVVSFDDFAMVVNYGLDRLRFPAPLFVGDSVRLRVHMTGIEEFPGGATLGLKLIFESSRGGKPVCVADALYRVLTLR